MFPPLNISAKSLILFNSLLAILGVPLDLDAISVAASCNIFKLKMLALLFIIFDSSSTEYISRRRITPNRSLSGAESCPALVVAPTKVNLGSGK